MPRWPFPIGATMSMIRSATDTGPFSSRNRSSGNSGVSLSKFGRARAASTSIPFTLSISSSAKYFSLSFGRRTRAGHRVALAQREPADLRERDVDVLGTRQVAGGPKEAVALRAGCPGCRCSTGAFWSSSARSCSSRTPALLADPAALLAGRASAAVPARPSRSSPPSVRRALILAARTVALAASPRGRSPWRTPARSSGLRLGGRRWDRSLRGRLPCERSLGCRSCRLAVAAIRLGARPVVAGVALALGRTVIVVVVSLAVRSALGARRHARADPVSTVAAPPSDALRRRGRAVRRRAVAASRARRSRRSARPCGASANPRCRGAARSAATRGSASPRGRFGLWSYP